MVYLKRYGFKFSPLNGENASYSFTRAFALLGGIILAFLFAGLNVPIVYHVTGFAGAIFLVSLTGEIWERVGFVSILVAVIVSLYFTASFHLGGLGRHQGIGLLYIYLGVVTAVAISDYFRSRNVELGSLRLFCILLSLAAISALGFGPFEAHIASLRKLDSCWIETKSYWRGGFHIRHTSWTGHNDVAIKLRRHSARTNHEPIVMLYDIGDSNYMYGETDDIELKQVFGMDLLGLELFQGGEKHMQWIGPVDLECYSELLEYLGSPRSE